MLRVVLVAVLSVSVVACKSESEAPKAQPGVAAGKVLEVSGTVMLRQADVARPLGEGDTVEGDDVVETGADGSVVIELSHNLARWELGASRKAKVRESTAWGLAKKSGDVKAVEQDSAAAGRHAERSAAETGVSASVEPAPAAAAPAAEAAPMPAPPPAPPPRKTSAPSRGRAAPPAALDDVGGGVVEKRSSGAVKGGAGAAPTTRAGVTSDGAATVTGKLEAAPSPALANRAAHEVVLRNRKAIQACLTKDMPAVALRITVAVDGTAAVIVEGKTDVPDAVNRCVTSAIDKLTFASAAARVSIEIAK
jgi:hypothetical protein